MKEKKKSSVIEVTAVDREQKENQNRRTCTLYNHLQVFEVRSEYRRERESVQCTGNFWTGSVDPTRRGIGSRRTRTNG